MCIAIWRLGEWTHVDACCADACDRNVLVGESGLASVKLSDLGMSRVLSSSYYRKTARYKVGENDD